MQISHPLAGFKADDRDQKVSRMSDRHRRQTERNACDGIKTTHLNGID